SHELGRKELGSGLDDPHLGDRDDHGEALQVGTERQDPGIMGLDCSGAVVCVQLPGEQERAGAVVVQEYPNVTQYAVGTVKQSMYMRELSMKGGQELSWASRPMSKVESALLFHTLKTATKPLQEFFFDTTGFTLHGCNGGCLTFTNVAPHARTSRKCWSWFLLQCLVNGYFLQPTGLEILVDHGSKDVQDWRVEQLWYNGKFYNSPEELAQKYADGKVDTVVLEDPLPKISPQYSTYKPGAGFPVRIIKGGPQVF
ncbi:hypothetical protein STEG23_005602, partial [Scotinomys teguina]